jgi:hypothetical protein
MIAVAGCVSDTNTASDQHQSAQSTPVVTPSVPEQTPEPSAPTEEVTEPEPVKTVPTTDVCMDLLDDKEQSWGSVLDTYECFLEKNKAYDCTYLLAKAARDEELRLNEIGFWVQKLYAGSYNCAKTIRDELPVVKNKMSGDPEPGDLTILNYYQCYYADAICSTTDTEMDSMITMLADHY